MRKYEVYHPVTGALEECADFESAKARNLEIMIEYCKFVGIFSITVLEETPDGAWVQSACDELGEPIPPLDAAPILG